MSMGVKLFQSLGIDTYKLRDNIPKNANQTKDNDWPRIESKVTNCTKCSLHKGRIKTVFGDGNRDADWFFVGEAPGKDEDLQGKPFVGRAGRLLTEVIFSIGLSNLPMGKLRGRIHGFGSSKIPTLVIYHPAYLLRSPSQKHKVWEDLQIANDFLKK